MAERIKGDKITFETQSSEKRCYSKGNDVGHETAGNAGLLATEQNCFATDDK